MIQHNNTMVANRWAVTGCLLIGLLVNAGYVMAQKPAEIYKYQFGSGELLDGFIRVRANNLYNDCYGFEPGSTVKEESFKVKSDSAGFVTSDMPFYFSLKLPEGNYKVTLTICGAKGGSVTTVKAESRRLMVEKVVTKPGSVKKVSFIVNIRTPLINASQQISINPREIGKLDWDGKLTLEFNGSNPGIKAIEIEKAAKQVSVYLAGNSTVVDQDEEPWAAWGQMITCFFKPGVTVANYAESGLTLGSFVSSKRLDKILSLIKPGDYLFIEFGHNDQKETGKDDGAYKSYTDWLKLYIAKAREHDAIPVIVTSTARRSFDSLGKVLNSLGDYPEAARKVSSDENVPLIDLNISSTEFYEALGVEGSKKAFVHYPANSFPGQYKPLADNTHFNNYGAYELARCIVNGIIENHLGLEKYLVNNKLFDPRHPDDPGTFRLPLSTKVSVVKPDGN